MYYNIIIYLYIYSKRKKQDSKQKSTTERKNINNSNISSATSSSQQNTTSASTMLLTSTAQREDASMNLAESKVMLELVNEEKNKVVYIELPSNVSNSWMIEGYYGVEESGILVPFHPDRQISMEF